MRIGIDVGGTNTDAVLMDGEELAAKVKTPTTPDVTSGIVTAIERLLESAELAHSAIRAVMIGTTHFTNAIIERRRLAQTGVLRLGLPATEAVEPFEDWPEGLRDAVGGHGVLVHGGHEFDGRELSPLDERELIGAIRKLVRDGVEAVAVAAVFSPVVPDMERRAAALIEREAPELSITLSHEIGRLGLLERENAAAINAALRPLAATTIDSFRRSLRELQIDAPLYLTQNDGTLMEVETAERYPVLTFASGPSNSMRGAAFLSGFQDALVLDVGGTTSDVGALANGFPRESSVAAQFADVRTNFRMPDLFSFGLGGGSIVGESTIGPESVGYQITQHALVFGGDTLTATDLAVAAGMTAIGDPSRVEHLPPDRVRAGISMMKERIIDALDRMKLSKGPGAIVVVGGGSIIVVDELDGIGRVVRPRHFEVANAVGAAIAQISGEVDKIYSLANTTRDAILTAARQEAAAAAAASGAAPASIRIVDLQEIPVAYMEATMIRLHAKAVGDLVPQHLASPS